MIRPAIQVSGNPHLRVVREMVQRTDIRLECLVVIHDDHAMIRRLRRALLHRAAIMLPVPQQSWETDTDYLRDCIDWTMWETEIRHLVFVGHSQGRVAANAAELAVPADTRSGTPGNAQGGYARLLTGVSRTTSEMLAAQQDFAERVVQFAGIDSVRRLRQAGQLALHALFYRAESGLFLDFDPDQNLFRPLQRKL